MLREKEQPQNSGFGWAFFSGSSSCIKSQNEINAVVPSVQAQIKQPPKLEPVQNKNFEVQDYSQELADLGQSLSGLPLTPQSEEEMKRLLKEQQQKFQNLDGLIDPIKLLDLQKLAKDLRLSQSNLVTKKKMANDFRIKFQLNIKQH